MTKAELIAYRDQRRELRRLNEELRELEAAAYNVKAWRAGSIGGAHRDPRDTLAQLLDKIDRCRDRLTRQCLQLMDTEEQVERAMEKLTYKERAVITGRYARERRWEDLARELHYSTRQVQRIHGVALAKLASEDVAQCRTFLLYDDTIRDTDKG